MTEVYFMNNATPTQMMGFVIRSAGKTVVIDGGTKGDGGNLWQMFSVLGISHVDAWFITHAHDDHYGAYQYLAERHGISFAERFYFNVPDAAFIDDHPKTDADSAREAREFHALKKPSVTRILRGDSFVFGDLTVDVLRVFNPAITSNLGNNSSSVLRLHDRKSLLILGDLGTEGGDEVMAMYSPGELHTDYTQMAHHGQNGVKKAFYEYIKPQRCLWASPEWLWDNDTGGGFNTSVFATVTTRQWIDELGTATEHLREFDGPHRFEL